MENYADFRMSRRELLLSGAALPVAVTALEPAQAQTAPPAAPPVAKVSLKVNGNEYTLELDTRTTLLDALREHLHLTGTKKGCDQGQCGACTVIVDGRRINSCLTLAVMQQGHAITTIEGLGTPRDTASDAGGVRQARRLPVRLLHAGPDLLGRRDARRDQGRRPEPRHGDLTARRSDACRDARAHERQHLPLRRLLEHRRRDRRGRGRTA